MFSNNTKHFFSICLEGVTIFFLPNFIQSADDLNTLNNWLDN